MISNFNRMAAASTELKTPKSSRNVRPTSETKVRVVVRIRPFLASETADKEGCQIPCITLLDSKCGPRDEVLVHIKDQESSRNECYKLDNFYGQENDLGQIFHQEVFPVIPGVLQGCNATVFAYGATGSGKTYTMQGTDEQPGLMPLAMASVLSMCENTESLIEMSYYEIYLDRCYDLLEPKAKEISVWENKDGQVQLKGLSQVPVRSISEFYEFFFTAAQRRKVAHTGLNDVSSRSHGVLMIAISTHDEGSDNVIKGKLNLIDLAGNEDNRRTCNEGIRLQESATINQSLFALSNVVYALNNGKHYVPYRDSKLTRILQDSLGGTSSSVMVACLNPTSYQEAVHTVSLAARSRQIVNLVSPARKQDSLTEKVDMEAKLHAWLESKGKTKSTQRNGTLCSPFFGRTPTSSSSMKKCNLNRSFTKEKKSIQRLTTDAKGRKLLDSSPLIATTIEESSLSVAEIAESKSVLNKEKSFHKVEDSKDNFDNINVEDSCTFSDQSCAEARSTQCKDDQSKSYHSDRAEKDEKVNLLTCLQDVSRDKENIMTPSPSIVGLPSISERVIALKNSLRKVFSPISSNGNTPTSEDQSLDDPFRVVMFKQRTPKTPLAMDKDDSPTIGTPLDRFNLRTSTLKSSLVQEYLAFLNTASREELQGLKGIGHKRADHIIELRESSPHPLQSLSDLEKIGLSTKQVHNLFRRTARGIFT